ncbi:MAG TPA: glycosyltransferase family 1 protein, partial [Anaeromyxobacter sp.]|nr:glycosyltransferase family 1 protein [Anaeromyxobacter sp.]
MPADAPRVRREARVPQRDRARELLPGRAAHPAPPPARQRLLRVHAAPGEAPLRSRRRTLRGAQPSGVLGRAVPSLWRTRGIVSDLRKDAIDVFHGLSNELPAGIEKSGVASVVTIHDLIFERFPELYPPIDRRIYAAKARSAARRAGVIVAVSAQTARDLVDLYGVDPARIRVVYQTCHEAFRAPVPEERLRAVAARYELPPRFLLAVGTIERRKNLLLALRALQGLPGVLLVAVGRPTPYAEELVLFARANGLADRVRLLSGVSTPDLAAMYRLATLALYPSLFEGFGIPIVEALCSGTPVVTTKGGCFAEAGGPGSAYVDPHDEGALRETIARLLEDVAARARMREEGL